LHTSLLLFGRRRLLHLRFNFLSDLLFRFLSYLTSQLPFEVGLYYDYFESLQQLVDHAYPVDADVEYLQADKAPADHVPCFDIWHEIREEEQKVGGDQQTTLIEDLHSIEQGLVHGSHVDEKSEHKQTAEKLDEQLGHGGAIQEHYVDGIEETAEDEERHHQGRLVDGGIHVQIETLESGLEFLFLKAQFVSLQQEVGEWRECEDYYNHANCQRCIDDVFPVVQGV
jgi:hypothetical protein